MANQQPEPVDERKWLTLGLARTMLGINEATLRQWADHGLVRAFRTPGGHRRFSAEDIHALIEEGTAANTPGVRVAGDAAVLPRLRRLVKGETRPHTPAWMERFDAEGHTKMREMGREFLDLCVDFVEHPDDSSKLTRASELGSAYGAEIASRDIPLSEALQAFFFFRNATTEALRPTLIKRGATVDEACAALEQLTKLTDRVLLGLTASYRQEPAQKRAARKNKATPRTTSGAR